MPTANRNDNIARRSPRSIGETKAIKSSTGRAAETRRLLDKQLVQINLRLPTATTQMAEFAFEIPVQEFMTNALVGNGLLAGIVKQHDLFGSARQKPTPRLRRAIASAEKIGRGRFGTIDDLVVALDKAAKS